MAKNRPTHMTFVNYIKQIGISQTLIDAVKKFKSSITTQREGSQEHRRIATGMIYLSYAVQIIPGTNIEAMEKETRRYEDNHIL